jgi:hypothetical protein
MKTHILIISLIILIIALLPSYSVYVHAMDTTQKTNIARDIQLLLSFKGKYKGPIDGICGKLTKGAIEEYDKHY